MKSNANDFVTQLQAFRAYAWNLRPEFGQAVDSIVARHMRDAWKENSAGFGDAVSDILSMPQITLDTPSITPATIDATASDMLGPSSPNYASFGPPVLQPSPQVSTVNTAANIANDLNNLVNTTAKSYLNVMGAYYGTQAQVNNMKLAAGGSPSTQAINALSSLGKSFPTSWFLFGGLGIVALVILTSGKRGKRR